MDNLFKIPKLKGSSNYDIWSIRLEALITREGYLDVITSDINNYTELEQASLQEKALKATSYIILTLEDGPLLQVRYIKNPFLLWATLKNLYEAKGFSSEFLISKELINTTIYAFKGDLEKYLNNFKKLINNLEAKDITLPNKFIIALLLNNLSKEYNYLVTIITQNIRADSSNLVLEDIMSNLLDEYRRIITIKNNNNNSNKTSLPRLSYPNKDNKSNIFRDKDGDIEMALATKKPNYSKSNNKTKSNKICSHCHKNGHLVDSCFILYPHLKSKNNNKKTINNTNSSNNNDKVILTTSSNQTTKENQLDNIDFILDSGATVHTCYLKDLFINIKPTNTYIKWGNTDKNLLASGEGSILIRFTSTNILVKLDKVLFVPELGVNLLSLSLITNKGFNISFNQYNSFILDYKNNLIAKGYYRDGINTFSIKKTIIKNDNNNISKLKTNLNTIVNQNNDLEDLNNLDNIQLNKEIIAFNNNTIDLLHNRLGHINIKAIKQLEENTLGARINLEDLDKSKTSLDNCTICIQSKQTKNRSTRQSSPVFSYLDLIYIDIGGPITPKTFRGYKYYITFRDSFTKYLEVKLLKSRKNIVDIITKTINELELEASNSLNNDSPFNNNKVKALQLDNEFKSKELLDYLDNKGIKTRFSSPYTPEQNGAAEIINRVLLNKVRALLINSNLPKFLWGEAILTACYLYNRTPNSSINFKTPYYLKYQTKPDISNIRIFGSLAFNKEPELFTKKLDKRSSAFYLVGFKSNNIYILYNPINNRIISSRDVIIIEGYFFKPNNYNNIREIFTRITNNNQNSNNSQEVSNNKLDNQNISKTKSHPKVVIPRVRRNSRLNRFIDNNEDELALNTIIIENNDSYLNTQDYIYNNIQSKEDWKSLYNNSILYNILNTNYY